MYNNFNRRNQSNFPDPAIRKNALDAMKKCVDICNELNAPILGGVNYAAWGYLTKNLVVRTNGTGALKI